MITVAEIQALLDVAEHPNADCTGNSAGWCPVCGDCTCGPRYEGDPDGERTLNDDRCPLHAPSSPHAMGDAEGLREAAVDVARFAVALAVAVLAEREARKEVEIDVCIRDRHAMMPSDLPTGLARHMGWHTDQRELADRVATSVRSHAAALTHLNTLLAGCPS